MAWHSEHVGARLVEHAIDETRAVRVGITQDNSVGYRALLWWPLSLKYGTLRCRVGVREIFANAEALWMSVATIGMHEYFPRL